MTKFIAFMPDKRIEEMNAYYSQRARWHDDYMSFTDNESLEKQLAPIVEVIDPLVTGRSVLEIACGTGNWTEVLAKRAESVLATDNSESMLSLARSKQYERDNVKFVQADAYDLGHFDRQYDVALAAYWYSHIPIDFIPAFMEGLMRSLVDGGCFLFFDMLYKKAFDQWPASTDEHGNQFGLRTLPDGSSFKVIKNFPTEKDLAVQLGPFATDLEYREFDEIKIWTVSGRIR